jgi:tetratricopeptide (TPR) repeat protein
MLPLLLAGCAAMFVPRTSDPAGKLRSATALFDKQGRPLPAERLIREAIDIYMQKNDELGLAEAYRTYGFFFRSPSIEKWSKVYRENGFLEKSATFESRYANSVEYFEKARAILAQHKRLDALTNVDLNLGFTYELMGDKRAACQAFDKSLESNREFRRENPNATIELPRGVNSYEDFIAPHRTRAGCS